MSYILDALRKADAQRERDPARGIHAQPLAGANGFGHSRSPLAGWLWPAAGAGLAVLLWAGWYLYHDRPNAPAPSATRVVTAPAPAPAPAPVSNVFVPPPAAATVQPPPPAGARVIPPRDPTNTSLPTMRGGPQPVVGTPAMPNANAPATLTQPGPVPAPISGPVMGPPPPGRSGLTQSRAVQVPPAQSPGMGPQGAPAPALPPIAAPVIGLPADAPKLAISGGVYSSSPLQRMLIVNGQVFNEGSEIGPGVTLVAITPKTAVLRFRGARYTVGY